MLEGLKIRSADLGAVEVSWFSALCGDDFEYLSVPDGDLRSSWGHCKEIVQTAQRVGFNNVLLPNSYVVGQDTMTFAGGMAALVDEISLLMAVRCGEYHPPMLARAIASLDHMLEGRLTVNIISSDMPGTKLESEKRYQKSREVIQILRQAWTKDRIEFKGDFYEFDLPTEAVKPYQQNGGPLLYFGGISPAARDLCAEECDVFLMWPEPEEKIAETMLDMSERASGYGREIDFGLRVHVVVRETEEEARAAAQKLVSKLDEDKAAEIKHRSQDSRDLGVTRQDDLREGADDDGYIEDYLWSGIGQARSGCGSAIVGDPDQVLAKLNRYIEMGIRGFVLSGYPHVDECELFGKHVLPRMNTCKLSEAQGRRVKGAVTPLTSGVRK